MFENNNYLNKRKKIPNIILLHMQHHSDLEGYLTNFIQPEMHMHCGKANYRLENFATAGYR